MAPSLRTYQAFAATFEALEAPFLQRETVLQVPGCTLLREDAKITPEEFLAEEDLHHGKKNTVIDNKVNKDNKTIHMSNLPDPNEEPAAPDGSIHRGPLTFNPSPLLPVDEDVMLAAHGDQAKLMQWHYCLGHPSFQKLKQLTLNGEIPLKCQSLSPPCVLAVYLA
jgi:hypothetical protein